MSDWDARKEEVSQVKQPFVSAVSGVFSSNSSASAALRSTPIGYRTGTLCEVRRDAKPSRLVTVTHSHTHTIVDTESIR
eukprot:6070258-Prymnesium_polylepis.2